MKLEDTFHAIHCSLICFIPDFLNELGIHTKSKDVLTESVTPKYIATKYGLNEKNIIITFDALSSSDVQMNISITSKHKKGTYSAVMIFHREKSKWNYKGDVC